MVAATINGTAIGSNGQVLVNTTVQIRNLATGQLVGTTTSSATGAFSFAGLPAGNFAVEVVNAAGQIIGTSAPVSVGAGAGAGAAVTVTAAAAGTGAAAVFGVLAIAATAGIAIAAKGGAGAGAGASSPSPQTLTTTATSDGPFSLNFSNIADGGTIEVTAYQSDNHSCSDRKTFSIQTSTTPANVTSWTLVSSLLNFLLILPSDLQPQTSDKSAFFGDICAFAGVQSDGHISAIFEVLENSDVFVSDASILNGQQNVFVSCSDQCLNIAQQSNQFLFQICSFTSDPVIIFSDGNPAHAISDHHVTIASITSQISDITTFSLIQIPNIDVPRTLPADPSTIEMLFKVLFTLIFFVMFGMIFFPG